MQCEICKQQINKKLGLRYHLKKEHIDISSKEYVLKYVYGNIFPVCLCGCGEKTSFMLKKNRFGLVVKGHRSISMKESTENKRRQTCLAKFGTTCSLQNLQVKEKTKQTNLKIFGVEHFSKTTQFLKKFKQTNLERYGVDSYLQTEHSRTAALEKLKLSWTEIQNQCANKNYQPLFEFSFYEDNRQMLPFKCLKHDQSFEAAMVNIQRKRNDQCPKCKPMGVSKTENEVADFVSTVYSGQIIRNTRKIIFPMEIDIWIPEKQLAIEFNGTYWHDDQQRKGVNERDTKKKLLCEKKNIKLIIIKEQDWDEEQEKVKLSLIQQINL